MKKVFLITEFGSPFEWTDKYIDNIGKLGQYGWYWKIFTPNKYKNVPDNVEIVDMTAEQYAELVEKKLGIKPNLFITDKGIPSIHITDFYIFSGVVFEDYIKDFDWWGITNMDVVYGRLDHFISDEILNTAEIFTDDVHAINGVFSLFKNIPKINNLYQEISNWKDFITQSPCKRCTEDTREEHTLYGSDEYCMTNVLRTYKDLKYVCPKYYPILSHDRLEQHIPHIKLEIKEDGSLWELFKDIKGPDWVLARPYIGREIPYFHFSRTKEYPKCLNK